MHSYLCFSLLEKRFLSNLDTSSKLPRHLAICQALKVFSYRNLNRSSTVGGSNEKVPRPSIASRQLVDRSSFYSCVFALFLNTFLDSCICRRFFFLNTFLDRWLDTSRHLYLSRFIEDLYTLSSRFGSYFFNLSRPIRTCSSPKHYLSHSKPLPKWFFQASSNFSSLGKLLISFIYMHFMFWNLGFGVFKNFWGFSKLMSYCWNFGMGFYLNEFKISCIALH